MPTAAGIHYFLHEGGSKMKAPLVLIHGAGGDHLSWHAEIRRMPGVNVYSLDLPGHGKSGGAGCQSVRDYTRRVVDFMDGAGLARAAFGGHGLGGAVTLELALSFPERAAGLVLISTGERLPLPKGLVENGSNPSTMPLAIRALEQVSFAKGTPEMLREGYRRQLSRVRPTLLLGDWMACEQFNVTGRLGGIHAPVLVLAGREDRVTPLHFAEALSSRIPGAALQTLEEAGHMVTLEQPRRLGKLMEIFLMTIPFTPGM